MQARILPMPAGRPKGPPTETHGLRALCSEYDFWRELAARRGVTLTRWLTEAARDKAAREESENRSAGKKTRHR